MSLTEESEPEHDGQGSRLAYRPSEQHPLVEGLLRDLEVSPRPASLAIADGDEMFGFARNEQYQHRGLALAAYFRSGWVAAETLRQLLRWRFGALSGIQRWLDFGSGFGRVTRFLVDEVGTEQTVGAEHAWISDINRDAVAFQQRHLGVHGFDSVADPAALRVADAQAGDMERAFEVVTVASLFTHLPQARFDAWLQRLWRLVAPGGMLLFSTNGETALLSRDELPPEGFYFERVSEIAALGEEDYGSTWVSPEYVAGAVARCCPGGVLRASYERGLWSFQDLHLVVREDGDRPGAAADADGVDASAEPAAPALVVEPLGYIDTAVLEAADELVINGWVIDPGAPGEPVRVRVLVDGVEVASTLADAPRLDIAEQLGEQHLRAGWLCRCRAPGERFSPTSVLVVVAESARGRRGLLHVSFLEGADLSRRAQGSLEEIRFESLQLRNVIHSLELRIEAMERSRFWQARDRWFALKRLLRLTDER